MNALSHMASKLQPRRRTGTGSGSTGLQPDLSEHIRTSPNASERDSTELHRCCTVKHDKIPNQAEQARTEPNKPNRKNLKEPEKTEARIRTISSVLLNFVPYSFPRKKFPEYLKPLDLSRSTEHVLP